MIEVARDNLLCKGSKHLIVCSSVKDISKVKTKDASTTREGTVARYRWENRGEKCVKSVQCVQIAQVEGNNFLSLTL